MTTLVEERAAKLEWARAAQDARADRDALLQGMKIAADMHVHYKQLLETLIGAAKALVLLQGELRLHDEKDFVKGQAWIDLVGNLRIAIAQAEEGI